MTTSPKKRRVRIDAPERVRQVVNAFETYLFSAEARSVLDTIGRWTIHWRTVQLDGAKVAMLYDMVQESGDDVYMRVIFGPNIIGSVTVYVTKPHAKSNP